MFYNVSKFAAKSMGNIKTSPLVSIKQLQDVLASDEIDPAALKGFRCGPVSIAAKRCVYSEQVTWLRDSDDQGLPFSGCYRNFCAALAEHMDAAGSLSLDEQHRTARVILTTFLILQPPDLACWRVARDPGSELVPTIVSLERVCAQYGLYRSFWWAFVLH